MWLRFIQIVSQKAYFHLQVGEFVTGQKALTQKVVSNIQSIGLIFKNSFNTVEGGNKPQNNDESYIYWPQNLNAEVPLSKTLY